MTLGKITASFDSETEVIEVRESDGVLRENVERVFAAFLGRQLQTPPMYSAVKRKGKPLYTYARKGKTVEREPKEIEIKELAVVDFQLPYVRFRIVCSKGTYVRSLVHDVGDRLGCGAMLSELRRIRIGPYHVADAFTIDQLAEARHRLRLISKPVA
jgi:tRNA pseudouridine55 synthase